MLKVSLIVNPFAANVDERRLRLVQRELERVASIETILTERPGHATELVTAGGRFADAVLIYGGDGHANEALNGLKHDVPVGFLPGGGTSALVRLLGLPVDPRRAAQTLADALARGRTRRIALGRLNGRRFAFCAGSGLDAEVVRQTDHLRALAERRPGDSLFVLEAFQLLASRRFQLEPRLSVLDHGEAALVCVANSYPYAYVKSLPLRLTPKTSFAGGLAFAAPPAVSPGNVWPLAAYLLGLRRSLPVWVHQGHELDSLRASSERPLATQLDGEDGGDAKEFLFEAEKDAVSVLC
jgi:diacylglycerol kinase family enzyme